MPVMMSMEHVTTIVSQDIWDPNVKKVRLTHGRSIAVRVIDNRVIVVIHDIS